MAADDRWAVEVLALLQEINQKLGFIVLGMEDKLFPPQVVETVAGEAIGVRTPTNDFTEDEAIIVKGLNSDEFKVQLSTIAESNPKTARAVRIARALEEPFQVYIVKVSEDNDAKPVFGIVTGSETKAYIERLRGQGAW